MTVHTLNNCLSANISHIRACQKSVGDVGTATQTVGQLSPTVGDVDVLLPDNLLPLEVLEDHLYSQRTLSEM